MKLKLLYKRSMKDKSLTVDGEGGISTSHCHCPRGKWIYSMAAAAIFVNKRGHGTSELLDCET